MSHPFISNKETNKKNKMEKGLTVLVLLLVLVHPLVPCQGALQVGYYKGKCGSTDVEATIRNVVSGRFTEDRSIVAALLRMQFHDCFVKVPSFAIRVLILAYGSWVHC